VAPASALPEYQLTAKRLARALLADEHGIDAREIEWVRGGIDTPGRPEKIALKLPRTCASSTRRPVRRCRRWLRAARSRPSRPAPARRFGTHPQIDWLYRDPSAAASDYPAAPASFRSCILSVCARPGRGASVAAGGAVQGLRQAKSLRPRAPGRPSAPKVACRSSRSRCAARARVMGNDYGLRRRRNRKTLEAFVRHHTPRVCRRAPSAWTSCSPGHACSRAVI